jgi:signal transduction histidine kinase
MAGSMKSRRWYWIPATVFSIGVFSVVLLLWVIRISEQHINDAAIEEAIIDARSLIATTHLGLDLVVAGDTSIDTEEILADLDRGISLLDATLNGGGTDQYWILKPLKDPELRAGAETIKSLIMKLKILALARLTDPKKYRSRSNVDRQFDSVSLDIIARMSVLELGFESREAAHITESRRILLSVLLAWTLVIVAATVGLWRSEKHRRSADEKLLMANEQLASQTEELRGHRENLTELVEKRTTELIDANERLNAELSERKQAEKRLKEREDEIQFLSSELVTAQEMERRRISMELHDELGQSLNAIKLHIMVIERGLKEDQEEERQSCENLLEYMNDVIENVRRLSLDLSPTTLEDLGLASALRWLVSNLAQTQGVEIACRVPEIDRSFHKDHWITIYRVIQEAFTNVGKHAQAQHASLDIQQHYVGEIIFTVTDDGKGFDFNQIMTDKSHGRGFGLTTMKERIRMIGGNFNLQSQAGQGTRITISVPIDKGGC